jgi:MFS family permease
MAAGATFLSPLADRFGRRRYILASLLLIVVSMLLSATAQNVPQLVAYRVGFQNSATGFDLWI